MKIMKKLFPLGSLFIIFGFSLLYNANLNAQSNASIENIDFYAEGMTLVITYDIVKAKNGELFDIWIKITTESGKSILPQSKTGDVGPGVSGGPNKRIVWDLEADNTTIDEEFLVEVFARSELKKTKAEKPKREGISTGGAMLLSAILPGLGKTIANKGGSQWFWGVIGYGCIAGTVVMNNNAYNAYEDYKVATNPDDRDEFFKQAEENDLYSKVFLGTAATIWVIGIITTGTSVGKMNKNRQKSGLSLNYTFDAYTGKPLVGFTYRF